MTDVGHGTGPVPRSDGERSLFQFLRRKRQRIFQDSGAGSALSPPGEPLLVDQRLSPPPNEVTRNPASEHPGTHWMTAPAESDTADELIIGEFWQLAGCPQLKQSDGETCCVICLSELGWLALDLIPRLIERPE